MSAPATLRVRLAPAADGLVESLRRAAVDACGAHEGAVELARRGTTASATAGDDRTAVAVTGPSGSVEPVGSRTTWVWAPQPDPEIVELKREALGQLRLFPGPFRDQPFVYAKIDAGMVRRRCEAELARRAVARQLSIKPPPLHFFVPLHRALEHHARAVRFCTSTRVFGLADFVLGEVWIDATLPPRRIVELVAHELMHLKQFADHDPDPDFYGIDEVQARRYGRQVSRSAMARRRCGRGAGSGREPGRAPLDRWRPGDRRENQPSGG